MECARLAQESDVEIDMTSPVSPIRYISPGIWTSYESQRLLKQAKLSCSTNKRTKEARQSELAAKRRVLREEIIRIVDESLVRFVIQISSCEWRVCRVTQIHMQPNPF